MRFPRTWDADPDHAVNPPRDDCTPINATKIVSGTTSVCDCFVRLSSTYSNSYKCSQITADYSITTSDLLKWNTWLGSSCDTNLYANMEDEGYRPLCVGINATQPIGTIASTASGTPSPTTITTGGTTTTVSMGPTASGEVAGCQQYHTVVTGDTCYNLEVIYDLTLAQLVAWNPSSESSIHTPIYTCVNCN
jgi:hypothetical protein